ncbi:MAG TPA: hypothetical protein VN687_03650, partial [Blastocatellia bacterium]|nr:hypothetical protein [Blastocatellia bacterium]
TPDPLIAIVVPDLSTVWNHLLAERLPYKLTRAVVLPKEDVSAFIEVESIDTLCPAMTAEVIFLLKDFAVPAEMIGSAEA